MFTRSVASTASVPYRQGELSTSEAHDPTSTLAYLRCFVYQKDSSISIDSAMRAFAVLQESGQTSDLSSNDILQFAFLTVSTAHSELQTWRPNKGLVDTWSNRFKTLFDELVSRRDVETFQPNASQLLKCLHAQSLALEGQFSEATQELEQMDTATDMDRSVASHILDAHLTIALSLLHHVSPEAVLDHIVDNMHKLTNLLMAKKMTHTHSLSKDSHFRDVFLRALRQIEDPSKYLSPRLHRWPPDVASDVGLFVLRWFADVGNSEHAYSVLTILQRDERLSVDHRQTLSVIMSLSKTRRFERANMLYVSLPETWPTEKAQQHYERVGLILFARQGLTEYAEEAFHRLSQGDIEDRDVMFLMHAYAVQGDAKRVEDIFDKYYGPFREDGDIKKPDVRHYTALLLAHSKRNDLDAMNRWLNYMIKSGITPNIFIYNALLRTLARRNDITSIDALMDHMLRLGVKPDVKSYTSVIKLLAERRDPIAAEAIFKRMLRENYEADRVVITTVMNAHVEAGSWRGVIRMFDFMRNSTAFNMFIDIEVVNTLLKAYVLIGAPVDVVLGIYERINKSRLRPTKYTYALLIQSACDANRLDIAAQIFRELEDHSSYWESAMDVTVYVLTIIMAAHLRLGDKVKARAVYDDMLARQIVPTSVTLGSILKAYANERNADSIAIAEAFLKTVTGTPAEPNSVWAEPRGGRLKALDHLYAPLMNAYAKELSDTDVERLYAEMQKLDGKPTLASLTLLLEAYRRTGDIENVLRVWPEIVKLAKASFSDVDVLLDQQERESASFKAQRRSDALCVPLSIFIDAASSAGRHLEVARTWNELRNSGFVFDPSNWNHLAVAMVRAGQPERAFEVIERVILPYQDYVELGERNKSREENDYEGGVESPLLIDCATSTADAPSAVEGENEGLRNRSLYAAQRRPTRRSEASSAFIGIDIDTIRENASTQAQSQGIPRPSIDDDYAFELEVLQGSTPIWHLWRPHSRTLEALLGALTELKAGRPVRPTRQQRRTRVIADDEDDDPDQTFDEGLYDEVVEDAFTSARRAAGSLQRIYRESPRAVRAVEAWGISDRRDGLGFGQRGGSGGTNEWSSRGYGYREQMH